MPLAILAAANAAVSAIQQGCELYKEYKGTVLKAKKTFDEVKGISKEVTSIWKFIWDKIFPKKKKELPKIADLALDSVPTQTVKQNKKKPKEDIQIDELSIVIGLIEQLKIFFGCMSQLQAKLAEAESKSMESQGYEELMSSAIDIEYAMIEIQKLQVTIRETMVYQSPAELGDLYTKVVKRVGVIQEQQELAQIEKRKKAAGERWLREQLQNQIKLELVTVFLVMVFLAEIWAIWIRLIIRQ
jgi:hypothetical protein